MLLTGPNLQEAERVQARHGSLVSFHSKLQAAALVFRPDPITMPGIDRIEALVNEECGTNLTSECVRRLRGKLCRILGCGIEDVDIMTMSQVARHLESHARQSRSKEAEGGSDERPSAAPSEGTAVKGSILTHKSQPHPESGVEARVKRKRGMKDSQVVMSLHGIRTRGTWQKELVPELSRAGFIPVPLDYGWFGAVKLLLPWSRQKQVDWFRDEYLKKCDSHQCTRPCMIAHSFGTYLVASSVHKYMIEFDRVIFCGAIVRRDYPWSQLIDHGLVQRALNLEQIHRLWR
jgi:hypothetical protein